MVLENKVLMLLLDHAQDAGRKLHVASSEAKLHTIEIFQV